MPYNGSGTYSPPAADFPAVSLTLIQATKFNNIMNDVATALSTAITKDGQTVVTANIPLAGFALTNARLRAIDGLVGTPGITFENDVDCGWYRIGVNNLGFALNGAKVADWATTALTLSAHLLFSADNTYDIGASGATRARDFFLGRNATIMGTLGVTGAATISEILSVARSSGNTMRIGKDTGANLQFTNLAFSTEMASLSAISGGGISVFTGSTPVEQARFVHNASATLYITLTGSNGGAPIISASAGNSLQFLSSSPNVIFGDATIADYSTFVQMNSSNAAYNWSISHNNFLANAFQITPSTATGGITYTTPVVTILAPTTASEKMRITAGGYFKASNSGTYKSSVGVYHEIYRDANDGVQTLFITNAAATATNQYGPTITLTGDPNNTSNWFLNGIGNATERFTLRANGGLANYSANNVNLSDLTVKPSFERYSETLLDQLSGALEQVDWGRFKYYDQTHSDWNHGYSAQGVRKAFNGVADELVDLWSDKSELLAVYHHDLHNIAAASAVYQIKKLKARVAELEAR